ncbi:Uu.00g057390.m01.CDS01 [Anthostomella pinea]|uniref:Protein HRI1 n=1 Tax=Anthostomella pinea TaxID=933095 RepID=A0AAI8VSG9_9PEZI|nr:Uu.00g057390.m01.CDS01 [Anthostomella pinea]
MASISIRDSIRWLPEPASEPTSTVVLTSPERRFVDIRILKPTSNGEAAENEVELPTSRLDWAFAGCSTSEVHNGVRHSTWRHFVDNRSSGAEEVTDEGNMVTQDDGRTLETGRMVNPATGRETNYEEIWTDTEPMPIPERSEALSIPSRVSKARCIVLELKNNAQQERGMVICLGHYCQGVVRKGEEFTLERWQWVDGKWERQYRMGSLWLPCVEATHGAGIVLGSKVKHEESVWDVVEYGEL